MIFFRVVHCTIFSPIKVQPSFTDPVYPFNSITFQDIILVTFKPHTINICLHQSCCLLLMSCLLAWNLSHKTAESFLFLFGTFDIFEILSFLENSNCLDISFFSFLFLASSHFLLFLPFFLSLFLFKWFFLASFL